MKTVKAVVTFSLEVEVETKVSDSATLKEIEDILFQKAENDLPKEEDIEPDWICQGIILKELKEV